MKSVPEEVYQHMVHIRRQIHKYPELAYEEHETTALIGEELNQHGIDLTSGIGKTGIVSCLLKFA